MFIAFMNFSIQTHQHQHQKEIPDSRSVFQMALCLCEKSFTEAQPIKIERNWMHTRMEYFCQCFLSVNNTKKRNTKISPESAQIFKSRVTWKLFPHIDNCQNLYTLYTYQRTFQTTRFLFASELRRASVSFTVILSRTPTSELS